MIGKNKPKLKNTMNLYTNPIFDEIDFIFSMYLTRKRITVENEIYSKYMYYYFLFTIKKKKMLSFLEHFEFLFFIFLMIIKNYLPTE